MHPRKDPRRDSRINPGQTLPPISLGHTLKIDSLACDRLRAVDARVCQMYRRAIALWVFDLLAPRSAAAWPADDPVAGYRDRNWHRLYAGSILDD